MPNSIAKLANIANAVSKGTIPSSAALAAAFGWADHFTSREIAVGDTRVDVARGYLGSQPAALFATPTHRNGVDPADTAALYGYHSATRWGILADRAGLSVFNSHLAVRNEWFRLPTIGWSVIEEHRDVLEAFEPRQIRENVLDQVLAGRAVSARLLQSVDDELVDCLDEWRGEALSHARNATGVDERLQQLFAQFFVLRNVEDRQLAHNLRPLSTVLKSSDSISRADLARIFSDAKKLVGSELFELAAPKNLPDHVIAGVIRDLYFPRRLPSQTARYNFSWIDSDVLGTAYEKYLSTVLHPVGPSPQAELFHQPTRGVERISVRKSSGVYYTPPFLTKYLASHAIDDFYSRNELPTIPRILDFACGSGSFLVAAIDVLLSKLKLLDEDKNWARQLVEGGYINGIDIDENAVTVARLHLWQRLTQEPNPLPLPDLSKVVIQADGLKRETWDRLDRQYDVILGNPPFLATTHVTERHYLEANFETALGRYDYSYLFVEQAIRVCGPTGAIGMVVPNRLFRNRNGDAIRTVITNEMDVLTIIDFGSQEIFIGTSAYVGCVVARHRDLASEPARDVRVVEVKRLPPAFVASFLLEAGEAAEDINGPFLRTYLAQHPRGPAPWILLSQREKISQLRLEEQSITLGEIAGIFQGIRTGANDIFIVQVESADARYAQITNGLGDTALIERTVLQPVIYGSELRKYDAVRPTRHLIYPYVDGTVISEAELEHAYPRAMGYFQTYRNILTNRTSIQASGLHWYELVRRRNEEWLTRPKLLIRDLAPETSFAVDMTGGTFIVGGTAVVPQSDDLLLPLIGYLNSKAVDALVRRTTPQFRGSFQKFEPQHIQKIPVLRCLLEDHDFADVLSDLVQTRLSSTDDGMRTNNERQIDDFVAASMQVRGIQVDG